MKILDIGCYDEKELLGIKRAFPHGRIWGMDIDLERIREAKKRILDKDVKIIRGFGEKIPFSDESFDLVYCSEVLEHVNNLAKTLNEIKRVLRRRGKLYITIPNEKSEKILNQKYKNYSKAIGHKRIIDPREIIKIFPIEEYKITALERYNAIEHIFWSYLFGRGYKITDQNAKLKKHPPKILWWALKMLDQEKIKTNKQIILKIIKKIFYPLSKLMDFFLVNKRVRIIILKK